MSSLSFPPPTDDQLEEYYSSHFPASLVWDLYASALGESSLVRHLDISLDMDATGGGRRPNGDVFHVRYLRAEDPEDLRRLIRVNRPRGVGAGQLCPTDGWVRKLVQARPGEMMGKVFELDFDLSEFSRQCACGQEKTACEDCWSAHAQRVEARVEEASPLVLGCKPLIKFSGRRGVHFTFIHPGLAYSSLEDRTAAVEHMEYQVTGGKPMSQRSAHDIFDRGPLFADHTLRMAFTVNMSSGCIAIPITSGTSLTEAKLHVTEILRGTPAARAKWDRGIRLLEERLAENKRA
jgi:hypothetical protein